MHKLQIIQHTISSYYGVPIRLYRKNALEEIYKYFLNLPKEFHIKLTAFMDTYQELSIYKETYLEDDSIFSEMIDTIQGLFYNKKEKDFFLFSESLYNGKDNEKNSVFTDVILREINDLTWETKPSYVLPFMKGLKTIDSLWGALVLANIKTKSQINSLEKIKFTTCFIGVRTARLELDDNLYISIGRYLELKENFKYPEEIQKITRKLGIESMRVTELLNLAKYRDPILDTRIQKIIDEIKTIFELSNVVLLSEVSLNRNDIELIVFFAIAIARTPKDKQYLLENLALSIKDHTYIVTYSNFKLKITKQISKVEYRHFFNHTSQDLSEKNIENIEVEFRRVRRRFIQNSKLREFEYKEMMQVSKDNTTKDILRKICNTVLAKNAVLLKYNVRDNNLTFLKSYGKVDDCFPQNDNNKCGLIEKNKDEEILCNSHNLNCHLSMANSVLSQHYNNDKYNATPYKLNAQEDTICLPVIYKGKLLGILTVQAEQCKNFNEHIINSMQGLSSILGQHIYKEIFDKNYLKIFDSFSKYEQDRFNTSLYIIAEGLKEIFFCYGISLWKQSDNCYENIVNTLSTNKVQTIELDANSVVKHVINSNEPFPIPNIKTYNSKKMNGPKLKYLASELDDNINSMRMYPIVDKENEHYATMTIYNRSEEEFNFIEEEQIQTILTALKTFFSIRKTIEKEGKLIKEHTLHDTNQHLLHIDTKSRELLTLIDYYEYDIPNAYIYKVKLKDIQNHRTHIDQAFGYLTGRNEKFHVPKDTDSELAFMKSTIETNAFPNVLVREVFLEIQNAKKITIKNKNLKIDIEDMGGLRLKIPRLVLMSMLSNLFFNAIKYSYSNTTIKVWAEAGDNFSFFIQNEGIEIKDDEKYEIFEYEKCGIEAIKHTAQEIGEEEIFISPTENKGIGLFLVNELVREFGGSLSLIEHDNGSKYKNIISDKSKRYMTVFKLSIQKKYIIKDK